MDVPICTYIHMYIHIGKYMQEWVAQAQAHPYPRPHPRPLFHFPVHKSMGDVLAEISRSICFGSYIIHCPLHGHVCVCLGQRIPWCTGAFLC